MVGCLHLGHQGPGAMAAQAKTGNHRGAHNGANAKPRRSSTSSYSPRS